MNVLHKWDIADSVTADGPFVGEPIVVDTDSVRTYPFEASSALLLGDYSGPSRDLSARELLRGQIDKARAKGFSIKAAFEFEFILLAETPETLRQKNFDDLDLFAPDNKCWSGLSSAVHGDILSGLSAALEDGGIGVEALGMELGPGCLEATLTATGPLGGGRRGRALSALHQGLLPVARHDRVFHGAAWRRGAGPVRPSSPVALRRGGPEPLLRCGGRE